MDYGGWWAEFQVEGFHVCAFDVLATKLFRSPGGILFSLAGLEVAVNDSPWCCLLA